MPKPTHSKPFILITSDYGWIGCLHWVNSRREPYMDAYRRRRCRSWGGCEINPAQPTYPRGQEFEHA